MNSSFSTQNLTNLLPKLTKDLSDSNYLSKDVILKDLNVENLSDSISILSTELTKYLEKNFLPIAAQLTFLLSQCYRLDGNYEKWLSLVLNCLSPNYQRFLPNGFQELAIKQFQEIPDEIYVDVEKSPFLPFDVDVGFSTSKIAPSSKINVISSFSSLIPVEMNINKILIQIENEQSMKSFDSVIFDNSFEAIQNKKEKSITEIKRLKPGNYAIKSVKINIAKALIIVPAKSRNHYTTIQVFPYELDTKFSIETQSIAITNFPYPILVNSSCLPPDTKEVTIKITTSKNCKLESGEVEEEIKITEFESNNEIEQNYNASVSKEFIIKTEESGDSEINVKWTIHYDTELLIEHEENLHIEFNHAFLPSFKIFGPNRIPFNLNDPPILRKGIEYAFITTFEYHLSYQCQVNSVTIQELKQNENDNTILNIKSMPIEMPVDISQSEGLTYAAFLSFLERSEIGKVFSPCILTIKFKVNCNENEFIYTCKLPEIQIEENQLDCYISYENDDFEKDKENTMIINCVCNSNSLIGKEGILKIGKNQYFNIKEENIKFEIADKNELKITFTPLESGTRAFPKISVSLSEDENNQIWESSPFLITK